MRCAELMPKRTVFVVGIMPRSGTNFLHQLLALHPDCGERAEIPEDRLLIPAEHLIAYAGRVANGWREWNVPEVERERLVRSIGDGLLRFLSVGVDKPWVVTKTPSVQNLELFFELFPSARLLILVRDGRAVAESAARTFGWSRSNAMRRWSAAARAIVDFETSHTGEDGGYRIVRYEELVDDFETTLRGVLEWCGLDPERYPFADARKLPLIGSSIHTGGRQEVHWEPVERPPDFARRVPWSSWSRSLQEEFTLVAGDEMRALGYGDADLATPRLIGRLRRLVGAAAFRWNRPGRL